MDTQINPWKFHARDGMSEIYAGKTEAKAAAFDDEIDKLHAKIGQLAMKQEDSEECESVMAPVMDWTALFLRDLMIYRPNYVLVRGHYRSLLAAPVLLSGRVPLLSKSKDWVPVGFYLGSYRTRSLQDSASLGRYDKANSPAGQLSRHWRHLDQPLVFHRSTTGARWLFAPLARVEQLPGAQNSHWVQRVGRLRRSGAGRNLRGSGSRGPNGALRCCRR